MFLENPTIFFIIVTICGFLTGFIDSIAGGGGLISLPLLSLMLGAGVEAVGTNKIAASLSAFTALIIYYRNGFVQIRKSLLFSFAVGASAFFGAQMALHISPLFYKWFLLFVAPVILWIVFQKDLWIRQASIHKDLDRHPTLAVIALGFACGFYDGIAGPGAGTIMFLSLFFVAKMPLLTAMATAKLANLSSALISLGTYAAENQVHWKTGSTLAIGVFLGAATGSSLASKHANPQIVRWTLTFVSVLLIARLAWSTIIHG